MIKDSLIYLASKFIPAILSFGVLFIFLTSMNPEDYGLYSVLILTIGLLNILSSQWIRSSMLRFYNDNIENFMGKTLAFQFLVIILNIFIVILISILNNLPTLLWLNLIIFMINFTYNELMNNYYRTIIRPKLVLNGNLIKNLIFLLMLVSATMYFKQITVSVALLCFNIGFLISNIYYLSKFKEKWRIEFNRNLLKIYLNYGLPLTISFALGVLLQNIDKYLITLLLGIKSNGFYSLVYDLLHNSLYMVMGALAMASLPRLLKMNPENIVKSFNLYVQYVYLISFPLVGLILTMTPEMVKILNFFGYLTTKPIVFLIILATFVHGINTYIYSQSVQLLKKTSIIFLPSLVAVVLSISLNFLLLEKIGVIGAAISSLIAFSLSNLLIYNTLRKQSSIIYTPTNILYLFPMVILSVLVLWNINYVNIYITIISKLLLSLFIYCIYIYIFKNKIIKKE